jgi:hypothetical protein
MMIYLMGGIFFVLYWIKILIVEEKLRGWELFGGMVMTTWLVLLWPVVAGLLLSFGVRRLFE